MCGINIFDKKCNRCGMCVSVCPCDAISLKEVNITVDLNKCTLCGLCWNNCKNEAIIYQHENKYINPQFEYSGICIYIEHCNDIINHSVIEGIQIARSIRQKAGGKLVAVLVGNKVEEIAKEVISFGVDEVWIVNNCEIHDYSEDLQFQVISQMINKIKPSIFLASGTEHGKSLMPRIAAFLQTGLCADCIEFDYDKSKDNLKMIRPAYSGKIIAEIIIPEYRPQMATIKTGIFTLANKIEDYQGLIVDISNEIFVQKSNFKVISIMNNIDNLVNLSHAEIVVAFGRGIKSADNIPLIQEFAKVLGGCIGATRAVVDAGWIDHSHQIGQTGKAIRPKIYIACGISGALQHLIGMKDSDLIIAINSDRNAPIINIANYAIIGDLFEIIPDFINELSKRKQNQ